MNKTKIIAFASIGLLLASCSNNESTAKYKFNFSFDSTKGEVVANVQNGELEKGTEITLTATPKSGYLFEGYFDKNYNALLNNQSTYTFTLNGDVDLDARFAKGSEDITPEPEPEPNPDKPTPNPNPNPGQDPDLIATIKPGTNGILVPTFKVPNPKEYYADFNSSLTGEALRTEIRRVTKVKKYYGYSQTSHCLNYIDESLKVPGKLYGIYDAKAWDNSWEGGNTWNKEHVWPQSHFEGLPNNGTVKGDMHNLRICTNRVNSNRGNKGYDYKDSSNTYFPNKAGADDDFRGDVARICFYMYAQYDGLQLVNSTSYGAKQMGKLDVLLKWNHEDPVDEFEKQRNMKVAQYQGNRNAFIDFPELADKMF